jgi:hypothetical protein
MLLAALLSVLAVGSAQPRDEKDKGGKTVPDKKPTPIMLLYEGKIRAIDLDKRELVLGDAMQQGSADKVKDKGLQSLTFKLTRDARIILDGRTVPMKALKAGLFARVHATSARASLERGEGAQSLFLIADRKEISPVVLLANRVEASTRAFGPPVRKP